MEKGSDISEANLAKAAEDYLLKIGMTANEIETLKSKLSEDAAAIPEVPVSEEPADEAPVVEEPVVEEPAEEPVVEEPAEEPVAAEPEPVVEDTPEETTYYIVVSGDCLWNIAKNHLGSGTRYVEIYELNKDIIKSPDLIHIGQQLVMPVK